MKLQKWGFGFDYEDKDGFYLSRNSDEFQIFDIKYKFYDRDKIWPKESLERIKK